MRTIKIKRGKPAPHKTGFWPGLYVRMKKGDHVDLTCKEACSFRAAVARVGKRLIQAQSLSKHTIRVWKIK